MPTIDTQNPPEPIKESRRPYSDFLPRFRALIELGNYSEDLETSINLIKALQTTYQRIHRDMSDPFHTSLRNLHEKLWMQGQPGAVGVFRVTTQYLRPAVYRLTVSCDNDEDMHYFSRTVDVFDNSKNLEDLARTLVINAISLF